jgi:hypothetical protein
MPCQIKIKIEGRFNYYCHVHTHFFGHFGIFSASRNNRVLLSRSPRQSISFFMICLGFLEWYSIIRNGLLAPLSDQSLVKQCIFNCSRPHPLLAV